MASGTSKSLTKLSSTGKKIDSPLAKYNSAGQLSCILCNVIVKSEMVWTAHVNGKQHREKVAQLKRPKPAEDAFAKPAQSVATLKRKAQDPSCGPSPSKKGVPSDFFDSHPPPIKSILKNSTKPTTPQPVPADHGPKSNNQQPVMLMQKTGNVPMSESASGSVPEGFFDDPKLDAKVLITLNQTININFLNGQFVSEGTPN